VKNKELYNRTGTAESNTILTRSTVDEVLENIKVHKDPRIDNFVLEFVSSRSYSGSTKDLPDGVCIIHQGNWEHAMGPLFGQVRSDIYKTIHSVQFDTIFSN
jgi:hypothetical protein